MRIIIGLTTLGCLSVLMTVWESRVAAQPPAELVRVGMIRSLFDPKADEKSLFDQMQPFANVVQKKAGSKSEFVVSPDVPTMARDLNEGKLQLAVLNGVEYGWLRPLSPMTKPTLIAVNENPVLSAVVLVAKDSPLQSVKELKGQSVGLIPRQPQHVRHYLQHLADGDYKAYFKAETLANADDAIEGVITGKTKATIVNANAWNYFQAEKPGRSKRVRVLATSPDFPAFVVIRGPSKVNPDTEKKFRESLLTAHETNEGKQMLTLWRLTNFQNVPEDYEKQVDAIMKVFPAPKP